MKNKLLIFILLFIANFFFAKNALAWSLCSLENGSKICGDVNYINQHPTVKCSGNYATLDECKKFETGQTVFWYACVVPSTENITCNTNQSSGQCGTVQFNSSDDCKKTIIAAGKTYQDTTPQAADKAAAKAAADAKASADAAAAKEAQAKKDAAKKALLEDQKQSAEMLCDCSVKGGQCRDDFNSTQEALEYCNSCGLEMPQSSPFGCPLGSKEVGPFSCNCGSGEKSTCSTYDTYSELKAKCPSTCGIKNGSCDTPAGDALKKLQKSALILNPAGFSLGTAGIIEIIGKMIIFLVWPIGMFAMALYIWAGFLWMTAQGGDNINKAKTIIIWTTLGIVATLSSYLLVQFVFSELL